MNLVAAIAAFLFFGWAAPDVARAMIPREKLVSIIAARMEGPTPIEQRVRERVNGGALAASAAVGPVVAGKSLLVKSFVASSAYAAAYELGGIPSGDVSAERYGQTVAIGTTAGVVIGGTTRLVGAIVSEVKRMPLQATLRDCRVEPWHTTSLSPAAKSAVPSKLYHYTGEGNVGSILENGLGAGGRRTFATPAGNLSPVQAQIELALPPNRGYPGALFEIDTARLQQLGINPAVGPQRIMSTPTAGGGGIEYIFNQPIPPSAIRQVPFP